MAKKKKQKQFRYKSLLDCIRAILRRARVYLSVNDIRQRIFRAGCICSNYDVVGKLHYLIGRGEVKRLDRSVFVTRRVDTYAWVTAFV